MNHIAMFTRHGSGHVNVMIPVIRALKKRGYQITAFASNEYKDLLVKEGCTFQSLWIYSNRQLIPDLQPGYHVHFGKKETVGEYVETLLYELKIHSLITQTIISKVKRMQFDLIMYNSHVHYAKQLAHLLNIPSVHICTDYAYNPNWLYSHSEYTMKNWMQIETEAYSHSEFTHKLLGEETKRCEAIGLIPEDAQFITRMGISTAKHNIVFDYLSSQLFDDVHPDYHFYGCQFTDYMYSYDKTNQIIVYLGKTHRSEILESVFQNVIKAFAHTQFRVLFVVPEAEKYPILLNLPPHCSVKPYVNLCLEMSRSKLFIFHGSMSGYREALLYKVPMICIPAYGDNFAVAAAIKKNRVGYELDIESIQANDIWEHARTLLQLKTTDFPSCSLKKHEGSGLCKAVEDIKKMIGE